MTERKAWARYLEGRGSSSGGHRNHLDNERIERLGVLLSLEEMIAVTKGSTASTTNGKWV